MEMLLMQGLITQSFLNEAAMTRGLGDTAYVCILRRRWFVERVCFSRVNHKVSRTIRGSGLAKQPRRFPTYAEEKAQ